ncbi:hypothetical protein, partial [Actinopolymorpha pittospori]|uniref:hypothetical protein n=1 Tax=Actinopolymorpha pittospori TaxID=648752 RepID=UPI0031E50A92
MSSSRVEPLRTARACIGDDIQTSYPTSDDVDLRVAVLLISGCQDDQLSLDGQRNGLFTQTLRHVWNDGWTSPGSTRCRRRRATSPTTA